MECVGSVQAKSQPASMSVSARNTTGVRNGFSMTSWTP